MESVKKKSNNWLLRFLQGILIGTLRKKIKQRLFKRLFLYYNVVCGRNRHMRHIFQNKTALSQNPWRWPQHIPHGDGKERPHDSCICQRSAYRNRTVSVLHDVSRDVYPA